MNIARLTLTVPAPRDMAQRLLRAAQRAYLRQRIRWAEQDVQHLRAQLELVPQQITGHEQWLQARRVELAVLEQQP